MALGRYTGLAQSALLFSLLPANMAGAQAPPDGGDAQTRYAALSVKKIHEFNGNVELAEFLRLDRELGVSTPAEPAERIAEWAKRSVGQPFRLYSLVYDVTESDCVTFLERSIALGCADNWDDYFALAKRLRYRDGVDDFLEANAFPLADWLPNNSWLFEDITAKLEVEPAIFQEGVFRRAFMKNMDYGTKDVWPGAIGIELGAYTLSQDADAQMTAARQAGLTAIKEEQTRQNQSYQVVIMPVTNPMEARNSLPMVQRRFQGAALTSATVAALKEAKLGTLPVRELNEHQYITRSDVSRVLERLRNGDLCFVIRQKVGRTGQAYSYCDHQGIIVRGTDGTVTLIHSSAPQVRQQDLADFLAAFKKIDGLIFLRLRPNARQLVTQELARTRERMLLLDPAYQDSRVQASRAKRTQANAQAAVRP